MDVNEIKLEEGPIEVTVNGEKFTMPNLVAILP